MKVGLKSKKYFHDIVVLPRSEMRRIEFELEKHRKIKRPEKRPLVLDAVLPEDRIKKGVSRLWRGSNKKKNLPNYQYNNSKKTIADVAELVLERGPESKVSPVYRLKTKTLFKNYFIFFLKVSFVALMIYNALSLYFEKNWLTERVNNLAIASKIHIANAQESISSLDRDKSSVELDKAGQHLVEIRQELLKYGEYSYLLPNHPLLSNELTVGQNILELGLIVKDTNSDINLLLDELVENKTNDENLLEKISRISASVSRIKNRINRADKILKTDQEIKTALGKDLGNQVENIIKKSKTEIEKVEKVLNLMPQILGRNGSNKYLVFFVNNSEMRPGGGFPGNYGIISFNNNNLEDIKIDNIYNLDRLINETKIKLDNDYASGINPIIESGMPRELYLPKPIEELSLYGYWKLFSSNWSIDFRDNAKRAIYQYNNFYPTENDVQGMIVITPDIIEEILGIVGPIKMENYDTEINKDNFREVIEFKVEVDNPYKTEGRWDINPKQILADFGPVLIDKISDSDLSQKIKIFELIVSSVDQKQLLLYHQDSQIESLIDDFGASGKIEEKEGDVLGVYMTNINARKNGRMIDLELLFNSNVSNLGFALNSISLTVVNNENNVRYLHGEEESYFEIIVPKGSRIREAKIDGKDFIGEIDYFEEAGHTVFGFHIAIDPMEAKNIYLKYQAPLKGYSESLYSLNLLKQPGVRPIEIKGGIDFEDNQRFGDGAKTFKESIDSDKTIKF